MMPKFSLSSSIRIKTSSKQKLHKNSKEKLKIFCKKQSSDDQNQKKSRCSSDYLQSSLPKKKCDSNNFVCQKILNPININMNNINHKRLTLSKNKMIEKQINTKISVLENNILSLKDRQELSCKNGEEQQKYQNQMTALFTTDSFFKKKSYQKSQNKQNLRQERQFSICVRGQIKINKFYLSQKQAKQNIQSQKLKIDKTVNIKIEGNVKRTRETQTFMNLFQQKYLNQYAKIRQLKQRSYQSFQDHFKYLQKLGHSDELYEQRLINLQKYFMQAPADERQKRVFDLMAKIRKRQYTLQIVFDDLVKRKQAINFINIRQNIQKYSKQFKKLAQNVKGILKEFILKFDDDASKINEKLMIDKIVNQIDQLMNIHQKSIQTVSYLEINRLNFDILQKQWRLLQSDNIEKVMIQRNCARKILDNCKSAYQYFGQYKKIIIQDEQFMKLSFNQRYQKILDKKCEDCVFIKAKAQILINKNKQIKPYAKVLNQIIKEPYQNNFVDTQIIDKQTQQQIQKKRDQVLKIERQMKMSCQKMLYYKQVRRSLNE